MAKYHPNLIDSYCIININSPFLVCKVQSDAVPRQFLFTPFLFFAVPKCSTCKLFGVTINLASITTSACLWYWASPEVVIHSPVL